MTCQRSIVETRRSELILLIIETAYVTLVETTATMGRQVSLLLHLSPAFILLVPSIRAR